MTTFTKEQLIANITEKAARIKPDRQINDQCRLEAAMNKHILEIALAALVVPSDIPPHVLDAMSDMCDGGFDAQGIWDLCRESTAPPVACPRCGAISTRPNGEHYCHSQSEGPTEAERKEVRDAVKGYFGSRMKEGTKNDQ